VCLVTTNDPSAARRRAGIRRAVSGATEGGTPMSTPDFILAAVLLTTPPGVTEAPPPAERWTEVRDGLKELAIRWELLDPRETNYLLARRDEFSVDVNLLRRRYQELRDAPRLADADRLPPKMIAEDMVKANRAFRAKIDDRRALELDRAELLNNVLCETDQLYRVWDAVRDAQCDSYYVTARRQALRKLRDSLGESAYARGELPPNLPVWRFRGR